MGQKILPEHQLLGCGNFRRQTIILLLQIVTRNRDRAFSQTHLLQLVWFAFAVSVLFTVKRPQLKKELVTMKTSDLVASFDMTQAQLV
jgi:hypothetical protein